MLMRTANPGVLFQFLFVRVGSEKMRLNSAHTHTLYPVERIRLCKAADRLLLPSCSSSSPLHAMLVACMEEKKTKWQLRYLSIKTDGVCSTVTLLLPSVLTDCLVYFALSAACHQNFPP